MKALNKVLRFLVTVLGVGSLVLFCMDFAAITVGDASPSNVVGTVLAFGGKATVAGVKYDMSVSADLLFCFILTAIATLLSIFSFKSKKLRYTVPGFGVVTAVYMLVIALSNPWKFIDTRPIKGTINQMDYTGFVLVAALALVAFTVAAVAYLLVDDYLEVLEGKEGKLTIPKRIVRFFRDYKSETKKIVWPGIKDVLKNTLIVLIMCALLGALIWVVDYGLGSLLEVILG